MNANYERSLAIVKPDGMKHRDTIGRRIREAGFTIVQSRIVRLTPEQASEFYRSKQTEPNYHALIVALTEGPIEALCVSRIDAIAELLWLVGPERHQEAVRAAPGSLRAMFADSRDELRNAVHASEDPEAARAEIRFFFPTLLLEPIFSEQRQHDYLAAMVNPTLMEGLLLLAKERPPEPVRWLSDWLLLNNPYKPKVVSAPAEPLYNVGGLNRGSVDGISQVQGGHVGAQSECGCSEYRAKGLCSCSLSTIAEME
ncbi:nucleoside diphosphate kinase homolog 5-like [Culex pipiens pallens]|uniref:nucleoside diphosphate kinase homolog 5-like n=1 Tax=Culex pipiens pallens TaxID=42434 RepID=UPI001953B371|nr:nucleoside diphosphate kinase homolog 5-like [Culex pipiens pallens]